MAKFNVSVVFTFYDDIEVEAGSYEEAENKAYDLAGEWLPYSSVKGYTEEWDDFRVEAELVSGELDD